MVVGSVLTWETVEIQGTFESQDSRPSSLYPHTHTRSSVCPSLPDKAQRGRTLPDEAQKKTTLGTFAPHLKRFEEPRNSMLFLRLHNYKKHLKVSIPPHLCVCERERESERVRERESERESVCERESVFVCERERE